MIKAILITLAVLGAFFVIFFIWALCRAASLADQEIERFEQHRNVLESHSER